MNLIQKVLFKLNQKYQQVCLNIYVNGRKQYNEQAAHKAKLNLKATYHPSVVFDTMSRVNNFMDDSTKIHILANTYIKGELTLFGHGGFINIGEYCYIGEDTRIWSAAKIDIGNRVLISHQVNIHDNNAHPIDPKMRHEQFKKIFHHGIPKEDEGLIEKPIVIEDDVWIGYGSSIMKGVKIGKGAIIGAHTVITKDVEPFTVVVGNPPRVIKYIEAIQ